MKGARHEEMQDWLALALAAGAAADSLKSGFCSFCCVTIAFRWFALFARLAVRE